MRFLTLRPLVVAAFVGLAALFTLPQVCFACSCALPGPPLAEAAESSAVFRAQVVTSEQVTTPRGNRYQRVTMRVTEVWKGNVTAETYVYTGSGGGDCGYLFQQGGDYLIYANAVTAADGSFGLPVGGLVTGICNRTRPIAQAGEDLAALGTGQAPTPGLPNTGAGAASATTTRLVPGELVIGGGALAALALLWGGTTHLSRRRT